VLPQAEVKGSTWNILAPVGGSSVDVNVLFPIYMLLVVRWSPKEITQHQVQFFNVYSDWDPLNIIVIIIIINVVKKFINYFL